MRFKIGSLDSSLVPHSHSINYWEEALAALCGRLQVEIVGDDRIDAFANYVDFDGLRLCQIKTSGHRVALPRSWLGQSEHPVVKVHFQTKGTSIFEQGQTRIVLSPGDCLAYDVAQPHLISSLEYTEHEVAIIPKKSLMERRIAARQFPAVHMSTEHGDIRFVRNFLLSALRQASTLSNKSIKPIADALLDVLIIPLSEGRPQGVSSDRRETLRIRAQDYIRQNLGDTDLTIDRIARALGCSKRYLHMIFMDEGITVSRFIWNERLDRCFYDLKDAHQSNKTITEVAIEWGFSSPSHFSRSFKDRYGFTPSTALKRI
ncbi:helix-turn-helix domain-containing protein [Beijerinckia indica]|uniref:Transcriptional regulator, AraC family n=1 Tax=Beijerinckia indica subsp. indica (strain ATCC 9039 / DSM 1715 / NCIMB 8712) TaxID=395963 RepID=B2IIE7_BEII9|nr:helix-turn-helix domain-containing protein [Beijerinckia indica]ACB96100.1 transcriptional regulator, AraC family [Beijerinckia indica subsp. indica ATCC 9039]